MEDFGRTALIKISCWRCLQIARYRKKIPCHWIVVRTGTKESIRRKANKTLFLSAILLLTICCYYPGTSCLVTAPRRVVPACKLELSVSLGPEISLAQGKLSLLVNRALRVWHLIVVSCYARATFALFKSFGSIWFYDRAWLGYENDERSRARAGFLKPKGKQTWPPGKLSAAFLFNFWYIFKKLSLFQQWPNSRFLQKSPRLAGLQ